MENIVIVTVALIPSIVQIFGYYLSVRFKCPKIRWIVFVVSMIAYYIAVYFMYQSALESAEQHKYRCGMWIILYYGLAVLGFSMPITQLIISAYKYYISKKRI